MKKLITESELKARVNRLKDYMSVVESEQVNEIGLGSVGTALSGAGNAIANGAQRFFGTTGGKVAAGAGAGAGALAAGQALTKPGQAPAPAAGQGGKPAAPAGAPKVAYDKTMPAATVQELQTKLNAKDPTLKLTVDGKLGPATKAAMAKYPDVTTDPNAPQNQPAAPAPEAPAAAAPAAAAPAAAAPAAPAAPAPQTSMDDSDDANAQAFDPTWGGTKAPADTRNLAQKVLPNFMGGKSAPVAANQNATWNNAQQRAVSNAPVPTAESVGYQNDELNRIINLIHHR